MSSRAQIRHSSKQHLRAFSKARSDPRDSAVTPFGSWPPRRSASRSRAASFAAAKAGDGPVSVITGMGAKVAVVREITSSGNASSAPDQPAQHVAQHPWKPLGAREHGELGGTKDAGRVARRLPV